MNSASRTKLSALNLLSGIVNRCVTVVLRLFGRIVFFRYLSAELYGLSGLFSNVLGLLSLAELGIGTAITYSLYKPLAEKDEEKIASLMAFFKKAYVCIASTVAAVGLALIPILPHLIRGGHGIDHFYGIYLIFLAGLVIEYLFSYKRTLAHAAQEGFRLTPFLTAGDALICLGQISAVFFLHENPYCFLIWLGIQNVGLLLQNFVINRYLDRIYPVLRKKEAKPLEKAEKNALFVNVKALMYHKIGGVAVSGTDNLLISRLVDLVSVGIYSNYASMVTAVSGVVYLFVGSTTASFGNLIAKEEPPKRLEVFREMQFFCHALYGFGTAFMLTLFQPFISLAYGGEYTLSAPVVFLVVVSNFYLLGITYIMDVVKSASGLYDQDKWVPLVQAGTNLFVSILLGMKIGLAGIFVGTFVSTLVPLVAKPVIVYPRVFGVKAKEYFTALFYQMAVTAAMCGASLLFSSLLPTLSPFPLLICRFFVTMIATLAVFFAMNFRSPHLPALLGRVKSLFAR